MASTPPSSEYSRELILRTEVRASALAYLEPLQAFQQQEEDSGGLPALWQILRAHRLLILLAGAAGGAAGLGISWIETPVYQAHTSLVFQSNRADAAGLGAEPDAGLTPESYLATQVRELKSLTLARRVVEKLRKENVAAYAPPDPVAKARALLRLPAPASAKTAPRRFPVVEVQVKVLDISRLVEIDCDSPDAQFAATYSNTLAQEYIDYSMEAVWLSAQRTSDWLTRQLQDMRTKLEQSENQLQAYTRDSGLIFTGNNNNVDDDRLRQIETELAQAQADRISKQSAYEIASTTPAESLPQVLDNGRLSDYQSKLADLRRQYAEQSAIYTPAHYKVRELQAQITDLETTLRRERANIVNRIQSDYQAALKRERMLQTAYGSQMQRVAEQSQKSIYYGILKREVETNQQVYEQLLQKAKQVAVTGAVQPASVRVLDAAEVPLHPVAPNPVRNSVIGFLGGLALAFGFVFANEFVNRSLRAPGESAFHLRVPELGVIPNRTAVEDQVLFPNILPAKSAPEKRSKLELVTWQDRPSMLAEAYRNALTSILVANAKGRPKVILITSPGHGEGKSSTVSNLGIALAEINQRVLLVDADLRKPRLHDIFNLPNSWGLTDLLREKSSLRDCPLEAMARKSEVDGLYVLPSGPGTVSITSLLYSARMAELVDRVRRDFDITIIDTPPMFYLSDARVLGRLADAAILVIRAARTTRDEARAAKQRLVDDGIRVLGTILNAWEPKGKARDGYSYSDGYGYRRRRS